MKTPAPTSTSTAAPLSAQPAAIGDVHSRLIIVGCCERKRLAPQPMPALDLYDEGCIPPLRDRLGRDTALRDRIRFLSARHGLVHADTPLHAYDQPLDPATALALRPAVAASLAAEFAVVGTPSDVLVIVEPLYLVPLADLLATGARIHWVPDHAHGWPQASVILDTWNWP